ncbi:MAG TPA: triose-phosphate isomerase [Thermoanaerobaculia bacterium]|nr:triose-phosphate isomerase [Thermoanaerobaculia bacterium]
MPNRYLIANWKMNVPPEGIERYFDALGEAGEGNGQLVVAPPFLYVPEVVRLVRDRVPRAAVAAQNCGDKPSGAFTGEVSPVMLRYHGVGHVIIGHSERRNLFGESDALIARKLTAALDAGLTPVLCIGEDLKVREAGRVSVFLADQIKAAASEALESAREVIVAYEPIWAIGTGRNASGAMVAETVAMIRESLGRFWPARYGQQAPILYGGSVTPDNISDLAANGNIDGYLVGGASLDSGKFLAINAGM